MTRFLLKFGIGHKNKLFFFYASQFNQNGLIPVKLLNAKEIHRHFKGNKIVRLLAINGKNPESFNPSTRS